MKQSAMIPYNDAFNDYLDLQIELERKKDKEVRQENKIKMLEREKMNYAEVKKLLDKSDGTAQRITPEDIFEMKKELTSLEIYGKQLEDHFGR